MCTGHQIKITVHWKTDIPFKIIRESKHFTFYLNKSRTGQLVTSSHERALWTHAKKGTLQTYLIKRWTRKKGSKTFKPQAIGISFSISIDVESNRKFVINELFGLNVVLCWEKGARIHDERIWHGLEWNVCVNWFDPCKMSRKSTKPKHVSEIQKQTFSCKIDLYSPERQN